MIPAPRPVPSATWLALWLLLLLAGCTTGGERVLLDVDGTRRWVDAAGADTVADLLAIHQIALGSQDRVDPPSFTLVESEMVVQVVRVESRTVQVEEPLPFSQEVRRDASLPQGNSRLIQLGQNGLELVTHEVRLENGREVSREVTGRELLIAPVPEVLVIGTQGSGQAVEFQGTVLYLQRGNAWLIREESDQKRALTRTGDLDGHVFALSPDGRWLLFTRRPLGGASGQGGPINTLWLLDVSVANEEPRSLDLDSVLWAGWQPCRVRWSDCPLQVAYSTGRRVPTPPGWSAHNDLRRFLVNSEGERGSDVPLLPASGALLGWWGRSWAWSPDGRFIAWGDATRIGLLDVGSGQEGILAEFVPFETLAAWVWTPQLSWAPDSRTLVATVHRATTEGAAAADPDSTAERSARFDLWRFELDGSVSPLVDGVGPFPFPLLIDGDRLLYGQVEDRASPLTSRYALMLREGDGGSRRLFPAAEQPGVDIPWTAWNVLDDAVILVWQDDLYQMPLDGGAPMALTAEGDAGHPRWGP